MPSKAYPVSGSQPAAGRIEKNRFVAVKRPENFVSCSKSKHSTVKKVVKTGTTDREIRFANPTANGHALIYHETRDRGKSSHHYGEMLHEHNMDLIENTQKSKQETIQNMKRR